MVYSLHRLRLLPALLATLSGALLRHLLLPLTRDPQLAPLLSGDGASTTIAIRRIDVRAREGERERERLV